MSVCYLRLIIFAKNYSFFKKNGSVDESIILVKGPLSGLEQFLTNESPLQV